MSIRPKLILYPRKRLSETAFRMQLVGCDRFAFYPDFSDDP